jgi:hypothetical protein
MSGSASFQRVKKSWYAAFALAVSPCNTDDPHPAATELLDNALDGLADHDPAPRKAVLLGVLTG